MHCMLFLSTMALALSAFSMVDAHARHHAEPVEAMARVHMATTHHGSVFLLDLRVSRSGAKGGVFVAAAKTVL